MPADTVRTDNLSITGRLDSASGQQMLKLLTAVAVVAGCVGHPGRQSSVSRGHEPDHNVRHHSSCSHDNVHELCGIADSASCRLSTRSRLRVSGCVTVALAIAEECYILCYSWATVCKTVRPMLSDRCLSCLPVCDVGVLWPNCWVDQDET